MASRSDATVSYFTVNGVCDCKDYPRAPEGLCSHRLAFGIARRAAELVPLVPLREPFPDNDPGPVEAPGGDPGSRTPPLPEAPASANCYITIAGRQVQLTLRDSDEGRLLQRLQAVLAQYPAPQAAQGVPVVVETPQCPQHGAMKPSTKGQG